MQACHETHLNEHGVHYGQETEKYLVIMYANYFLNLGFKKNGGGSALGACVNPTVLRALRNTVQPTIPSGFLSKC